MINSMKLTISQVITFGLLFAFLARVFEGLFEEVTLDFEKGFEVHGSDRDRLAFGPIVVMATLRATHDLFNLGCHDIEEILRRSAINLVCLHGRLLINFTLSARDHRRPI